MQIPTLINRGRNGFNMTPMIDVVFLLIIFFLVTSHLSDQESQIEMELPEALSGTLSTEVASGRITVHVPRDETLLVGGRKVTLEMLKEILQQVRAGESADLEIRIRTDRQVAYESIAPLLRILAESGIWNVSFAVYEKRGEP